MRGVFGRAFYLACNGTHHLKALIVRRVKYLQLSICLLGGVLCGVRKYIAKSRCEVLPFNSFWLGLHAVLVNFTLLCKIDILSKS